MDVRTPRSWGVRAVKAPTMAVGLVFCAIGALIIIKIASLVLEYLGVTWAI